MNRSTVQIIEKVSIGLPVACFLGLSGNDLILDEYSEILKLGLVLALGLLIYGYQIYRRRQEDHRYRSTFVKGSVTDLNFHIFVHIVGSIFCGILWSLNLKIFIAFWNITANLVSTSNLLNFQILLAYAIMLVMLLAVVFTTYWIHSLFFAFDKQIVQSSNLRI